MWLETVRLELPKTGVTLAFSRPSVFASHLSLPGMPPWGLGKKSFSILCLLLLSSPPSTVSLSGIRSPENFCLYLENEMQMLCSRGWEDHWNPQAESPFRRPIAVPSPCAAPGGQGRGGLGGQGGLLLPPPLILVHQCPNFMVLTHGKCAQPEATDFPRTLRNGC